MNQTAQESKTRSQQAKMKIKLQSFLLKRWSKTVLWMIGLLPFAFLVAGIFLDELGANPAEYLIRSTGDWTLRFLCLSLAVTPLRIGLGLPALAPFRRVLGLLTYFYAFAHLLCYAGFDMGFEFTDMAKDIVKRPFILVGFCAMLFLTPLALTSSNASIRRLGGRNWQRLHRLVYVIAILAILHFFWMRAGKNNFAEVAVYAAILAYLLFWRVQRFIVGRRFVGSSSGNSCHR